MSGYSPAANAWRITRRVISCDWTNCVWLLLIGASKKFEIRYTGCWITPVVYCSRRPRLV